MKSVTSGDVEVVVMTIDVAVVPCVEEAIVSWATSPGMTTVCGGDRCLLGRQGDLWQHEGGCDCIG